MTKIVWFYFILGLLFSAGIDAVWANPSYMDSDYYLAGGIQLSRGAGFEEWTLWNYLDDPDGLPHPSHAYWMPLASILAAIEIRTRLPIFMLLSAGVVAMTVLLAIEFAPTEDPQRRRSIHIAGGLALLPGFYAGFLTIPDSFAAVMLLGGAACLIILRAWKNRRFAVAAALGLGVIGGLQHLARADGVLWAAAALAAAWYLSRHAGVRWTPRLAMVVVGYSIVMVPWLIRNQLEFGSLLAPGGARLLWMTSYDDLFAYPPQQINFSRWISNGIPVILGDRLWALGQNLQTALAVQGAIVLAPLIVWAIWSKRDLLPVRILGSLWIAILTAMTILFPYSGARGGFFHSGAALQPLFWAIVPVGLTQFIDWGRQARGWKMQQAFQVFTVGLFLFAGIVTGMTAGSRGSGGKNEISPYLLVEEFLRAEGAGEGKIVMVNNPPGYYLAGNRPAIVIPSGGVSAILAAAERFGAGFLVLEPHQGLDSLYRYPEGNPGLRYLGQVDNSMVFAVEEIP